MRKLWAALIHLVLGIAVLALLADAVIVGLHYQSFGLIVLVGIAYRLCRRGWQVSGSYGTARLAGLNDLLAGNLLCDRGLILGRVGNAARPSRGQALGSLFAPRARSERAVRQFFAAFFRARRVDDFIRIRDFVHLATFAPAGAGKSTGVLVPNLLSYEGNCVVVDPKGELYNLTAKHRQKQFGHMIVRLDPARLYGPGDCFNPLDWVDAKRPDFIDVCRDLANMLVVRTGKEMDPHWCDSAENVIAAFIAYICALEGNPAARNVRGVRAQLASRDNYNSALEVMQQHDGFHGVLQQLGHSLGWHVDKELGSVMSHAQRFTNIFDAPLLADNTSSTTFDPRKLRTGKMTVYLITPADKMVVWAGLQRLWLGSLLRIITRGVATEKNPVLFLVDEAAHIAKMQALEDAVTLMRGMGIRLWLFFQSLEQVKKCYGDNAGTVLDNLATQQYFSINSYETAEAMSKRIGDETVVIRSEGTNSGTSTPTNGDSRNPGSSNSGRNSTTSEIARRLLKPEEILVLPEHTAVIFHKNNCVIVCNKIKYYADRAFRQRGMIFHRWGTGRTQGLGLSEMLVAIAILAVAYAVTMAVASSPMDGPLSGFG
jgi:type IV secretion system protein VirD4